MPTSTHTQPQGFTNSIIWRFVCVLAAVIITIFVSQYASPLVHDPSLSPLGTTQSGWPLPFAASFWDESVVNAYQASKFNLIAFIANIAIFSLLIFSMDYGLHRIFLHTQAGDKIPRYIRYFVQITTLAIVLYVVISMIFTISTNDILETTVPVQSI
jgi:uncharacterized ion transporter superfamily protein YfcC